MTRHQPFAACLIVLSFTWPAAAQQAVSTAFTYQGELSRDCGQLCADEDQDLRFTLWDDEIAGSQVGPDLEFIDVQFGPGGRFAVELDFGVAVFDGDARWLRIEVRPTGGQFYTILNPRQPITAAPYALHALNAGQWENSGSAITNTNTGFVGINRDYTVGLEWFGVHAPVNSGYGGMYVTTEGSTAWPFYGYRAGSQAAWTYLDGGTGSFHVNVDGNRMTVTDNGRVGIGTTSPEHRLHVVSNLAGRAVFGNHTSPSGTNYGGYFSSSSSLGTGVAGVSPNIGVEGQATGASGIGVFGSGPGRGVFGTCTGVDSIAGEFIASGNNSRGVYGAANTGNFSYGVYGEILDGSSAGIGVYGRAPTYGVTGEATNGGVGVVGRATTGLGVYGESGVANGTGVMGANTAASGTTYGVQGIANSAAGYAGHFSGRGYFSGNLGLGTLSPANQLSVAGGADISGQVSIGITGADARLLVRGTAGEDAFRVRVEGATKLLVKDNGGVGIGSNFGSLPANGLRTAGAVGIGADPGAFTLVSNGDAAKPGGGSWSSFSDARLKRDIKPLTAGTLERLLTLRGHTFEYIEEAIENRFGRPGVQTGFVAQEVKEVFPDWVDADDEGYLYVTERGLSAIMVEALRELRAEKDAAIASLKADNDKLEQRLAQLEAALAKDAEERIASGK